MGAHDILDWLFGWLHPEHVPTGWQRTQDTGSYQLPALFDGIAGGDHWNGAPGSWAAAYKEEHNHTGDTPIPPTPGETGGMQRVQPLSIREIHRLRGLSEAPTSPQLPGPEWLYGQLPAGALPASLKDAPVLRQSAASPTPTLRPIVTNTGALDDMLLTLRPARDRYRLDKPAYQDLPTVPNQSRLIEQTMEALPPAPEDFPRWLTADPPTLIPLPEQELSVFDRVAVSAPIEPLAASSDALSELATLASQKPNEDTLHVPAVMKKQHLKESE